MKLQDVGVIVTGGASGLGAATAHTLAANGARVAVFDLNAELGRAVAEEIGGIFVQANVADEESVVAAIAEAEQRHGAARVLVNCAGIGGPARAVNKNREPLPLAQFRKIIDVNLIGTFNVASKFAARAMALDLIGEERGVIVNTASIAAFEGQIGQVAYSASKGGVVALTVPLAREFAQSAIRVVTVAPGLFLTPLLARLPEETLRSLGAQAPFPSRLGEPSEYALLVEAIIANPMLNGETIRLDGAIRMAPR